MNRILAIALCRVSSLEQLLNNSLKNQKSNVFKAADTLGATIPADGVWEGQVSSKKGVNFKRKDLLEMFDYCKKHPSVKYLIVQEVDRFMRSPEEQAYWMNILNATFIAAHVAWFGRKWVSSFFKCRSLSVY